MAFRGRQQPNAALSSQLFAPPQGGGSSSTSGSNSGGNNVTTKTAQCSLTRWFKPLYRGSCELREIRGGRGSRLEVSLQDGVGYTHQQASRRELSDQRFKGKHLAVAGARPGSDDHVHVVRSGAECHP